jgi:membrane protein DedA with SNARE-associated domain
MTMDQAIRFLMNHGAAALFVAVLAEQAGLPVPSVPLLLAIGYVTGGYTCSKQLHRVSAYGSSFGLALSVVVTCVFAVVALVLSVRRR